jgi:hypothetical protein
MRWSINDIVVPFAPSLTCGMVYRLNKFILPPDRLKLIAGSSGTYLPAKIPLLIF